MSLGTGSRLNRGLITSGIARRYPWQAGASGNHPCLSVEILTWPHTGTYQCRGEGVGARIHKELLKCTSNTRSAMISSKCQQEMQRKWQDKQMTHALSHPTDHLHLRVRSLIASAWNLTLPKLDLATHHQCMSLGADALKIGHLAPQA